MSTQYFGKNGWTPERIKNLHGKTYLITGTNTGAGFEAARMLLSKGAEVVMLNRSEEKTLKAIDSLKESIGSHIKVSFIKLDLSSLSSVRRAAEEVIHKIPHIDALICNAAVAQIATRTLTADGFEMQLGVNYYAYFLLTQLLFDKIEQSKGRIVYVSSEGYKMGLKRIKFEDMNFNEGYAPNTAYAQSKLALMVFAYELQRRIKKAQKQVKVYVCHPGAAKTSLIRPNAPWLTRATWWILAHSPLVQSAEKGAYPEVMCATEENLKQEAFYGPTGFMQWSGPVGECKVEPFVFDETAAAKLWAISEEATHCKWTF
ncbi:SDR family oxidoreductase [Thermonema rossianum]|uniref:SDR family oxidoreductase n=1 Tax=Thermonema rossianum TaxID=55505 RepID=UPI00056F754F|nr:SDR family oxidoreductase [Thermonema rossianum]